jgi:hypothetical protein
LVRRTPLNNNEYSPTLPPLPTKKTSPLSNPQFICFFLIGFTGFLFLSRPTTTAAQLVFRLALMLIGVIGLIVIWMVRRKQARQRPPSDRLIAFLNDKRIYLIKRGIDVDSCLLKIQQHGALAAIEELIQNATDRNVHLPPGLWNYFHRLKAELEKLGANKHD